jgi:hypothetical protein
MKKHMMMGMLALVALASCQQKKESHDGHHTETTAPVADTTKKSIPSEVHAMIGEAHITILYHAPAVRGRQIWGGLVPYDEVWVTGAHQATSFEINQAFSINDQEVPAGKYALFTIPGKETWTFVVNKNWDQHLADEYNSSDDVLRFTVTPEALPEVQERLQYQIKDEGEGKATLSIAWEKVRLRIPITIR